MWLQTSVHFSEGSGNGLERFTKRVGSGLIVLLVEEGFSHAEIGERPAWLDGERSLILLNGGVVVALFGELFAAGNGGACAQGNASFEDEVIGVNLDAAGFGTAKGLDNKRRVHAENIHPARFRVAFCIDAQLDRHAERVDGLLDLADDAEAFGRAIDDEIGREIRDTSGVQPLHEKSAEIRRDLAGFGSCLNVLVGQIHEIVDVARFCLHTGWQNHGAWF